MPSPSHASVNLPSSTCNQDGIDWRLLLGREPVVVDPLALAAPFEGKRILITGAGGSIGSALANCLAQFHPGHLVLLDSSEHGLYEVHNDLASHADAPPHTTIPGDICDNALLHELFSIQRPQIVFHAAAYKHVPLMEHHPLAALRTNALGTSTLAQVSQQWGVEQLVMLSTDKAVTPSSIMGASKRIAELALLASDEIPTCMKALRLGNVLGSRGSVVPLFKMQIEQGGPVTVTDPDVCRYLLPLRESVELLLSIAGPQYRTGLYIPQIGEPIRILDLAHFLIDHLAIPGSHAIPVVFTGLRPGDKLTEDLLSSRETADGDGAQLLRRVRPLQSAPPDLPHAMEQLQHSINQRATEQALQIVRQLVPEYQPSPVIRNCLPHPVNTL